jgi:iron complex outermembrane receptor protein
MSMRILFYFLWLFFFHELTHAALVRPEETVIPPVVVKKSHAYSHSVSSGPKTVVSRAQIAATGTSSLPQALQTLAGLQLLDTSGNGSQLLLSMRGFGANASSNTLLLVNGIPITNPDLAPPDLNTIPIQEIEAIEIVSGSESVLYGDQAVGGVINILTNLEKKSALDLSCTVGSYNQRGCFASLMSYYQRWRYGLNLMTNHTDNYREHNNYDQNLMSGNLNYLYQAGSVNFNYRLGHERMLYPGALTATQVREDRRQAQNNINLFRDWNGFFQLNQQHTFTEHWQESVDLVRRDMYGNGVLFSPFTQSRVIQWVKPQLKASLGNNLVKSGIELEEDHYRLDTLFGVTNSTEQKYGLYFLDDWQAFPRISFAFGVRDAQQNSQLNSGMNTVNRAFATTLGTTYQYNSETKMYLRRAGSFRFPKADEIASMMPGSPGLKTQTGVAYETGIEWQQAETRLSFNIYQLNLKDEIAFDPMQTPQDPFGTNRNLAPTVRQGFSLAENYPLTQKIIVGSQYNYVNARYQSGPNAGNRIPLVSESIFHAGIDFKATEDFNFYTEAVFTGNQYAANDDANITRIIGGYMVYNFTARFQRKPLTISLRMNNIFNKPYYLYTVYTPSIPLETFYPAPERNVLLTVDYALAL